MKAAPPHAHTTASLSNHAKPRGFRLDRNSLSSLLCLQLAVLGSWFQALARTTKAIQPPNVAVGVVWITASPLRWKNRGKLSHMPTQKLTPEILTAAILGMEAQKEKLDAKIAELRGWLTGGPTEPTAAAEPATPKRRRMSAAARKRIGDAQRKRWAASKKATEPPAPAAAPKPKRKLSAAGRKAIIAATKKRWEAFHKAEKPAPAKKKMSPASKAALLANLAKARAARAAKRGAAAKPKSVATKQAAAEKPAKKSALVKKAAVKKSAAKGTAPAAAQSVTETGCQ